MKLNKTILLVFILAGGLFSGCKKYLDINSDPSSPQTPDVAALMIPATSIMSKMQVIDVITVSQYLQNFSHIAVLEQFDVHGGNNSTGSVANALWRSFYAQQGQNINLVIKQGIQDQRWDYVGAATALRAWGLQMTTNYFGELPYKQAWDDTRYTFKYDDQPEIYKAIDSLCLVALDYLQRKDGSVNTASMARGDRVYGGNTDKWIKFVYGIRARHWQHLTNKTDYNADSVIFFVDRSFSGNADNFYITHTATRNDDSNPMGPARDNFTTRRQSRFTVQLLDGTIFYAGTPTPTAPSNRDPRLRGMLTVSPDTTTITTNMPTLNGGYRFLIPAAGYNAGTVGTPGTAIFRQAPSTPYADSAIVNPALNNFSAGVGKYLFRNAAPLPIMTYHELQFIKAEAAFRKGLSAIAHSSYINGISTHFDFVDFYNSSSNPSVSPIVPQRAAYLASAAVKTAATLTFSDIMLQKYIGDWGWNLVESWSDMRRYHYFDVDPASLLPVYRGYALTTFSSNNQGPKPAYRYRPTNFSEFDWNLEELRRLGAPNIDYHTYEMWFSKL